MYDRVRSAIDAVANGYTLSRWPSSGILRGTSPTWALFTSGEDYLEIFDEAHATIEDRFIAIGLIARGLVLVVWTEWDDDVVRIISARWATPAERTLFTRYREGRP